MSVHIKNIPDVAKVPPRLQVISLFSGIGGLDLGFSKFGIHSAAFLEVDKWCCETLSANRHFFGQPNAEIKPLDITAVSPEDFYDGKVDLIIGGPPCQSFSAAGRRAGGVTGTDDARGSLFWYYCRYVEHFQPKAFVFENVRGILSSKGGRDWEIIKTAFRDIGYKLFWRVLNAADYGTPQSRERLFLVGIRGDLKVQFQFPLPTFGPDSPSRQPYVTAREAISDLDDLSIEVPPYGGKYGDLLPGIPLGENYRFYTEEMGHPHPLFAWRSKFSGFLYKLDPEDVSKTIVAQQGRYDGPFHWRNRKCTVPELQRLQGFPDDFRLPHGHSQAAKQIGNSVAPPVAAALANAVLQQLGCNIADPAPLLPHGSELSFDKRKGQRAQKSRAHRRNVETATSQNDLFKESSEVVEKLTLREVGTRTVFGLDFMEEHDVREGSGSIRLTRGIQPVANMDLSLTFTGKIGEKIKSISCSSDETSFESYFACWQSIHDLVSRFTSFPSLAPLYGHFTEPYPKFSLSFTTEAKTPASEFLRLISDFEFTRSVQALDLLSAIGISDPEAFLKSVRVYGIDARTHHTNRTIPQGQFRVCYPFATPASERQFVVWTDEGQRKRHDFQLSALAK